MLTPGLVDVHNNGAFGVDFAMADAAGWSRALAGLAARGVTSVLPTVITAPLEELVAALGRAASFHAEPGQARMLGIHLEGPFLSPAHPGAHRVDWILDPAHDAVSALLAAGAGMLRMVTLAPERPGGMAAVRRFVEVGIMVSLGHSDADAGITAAAVAAGASCVTHVFNAMRPLRHRDPGLVGVALTEARVRVGLIVDGLHVDPVACRLVFAAAAGRVMAVSDSILVAGLAAGATGWFGGGDVVLDAAGLGRRQDGTISGGGIVLDEGMRRLIHMGIDPAAALHAATEVPADALGRPDLGRIAVGAVADLVWWDADWVPRRVWVGGIEV